MQSFGGKAYSRTLCDQAPCEMRWHAWDPSNYANPAFQLCGLYVSRSAATRIKSPIGDISAESMQPVSPGQVGIKTQYARDMRAP